MHHPCADVADALDETRDQYLCLDVSQWSIRAGKRSAFSGAARTVRCVEDNSFVKRAILKEPVGDPEPKVLVVDGGGSRKCALVGDKVASMAIERGFVGIVVYGCVRDVDVIDALDVGVLALGACPVRSVKKQVGEENVALTLAESRNIFPGDFVFVDRDGMIVCDAEAASRATRNLQQ